MAAPTATAGVAPTEEPTPSPTAEPVIESPTPEPTQAPAVAPAPTRPPAPPSVPTATPARVSAPSSATIDVSTAGEFTPKSITIGGSLIALTLDNKEAGIPHNLGVKTAGNPLTTVCTGPCTVSVSFTAPAPGSYQFYCAVHPEMVGTLTVSP